jgi:hypothetical protein
VSVGHVARSFEDAGLVTVAVFVQAFEHYARAMRLPRTLITPHPMGRPLGPPHNPARQRETIEAALAMIDTATAPGAITHLGGSYRPGSATS